MVDDDGCTIYPYQPDLSGSLKLGQQIVLCLDGGWADLNGPYCEWPKRKKQQFIVIGSLDAADELTMQDIAFGRVFFEHNDIYISEVDDPNSFRPNVKWITRDEALELYPNNIKLTDKMLLADLNRNLYKEPRTKDWKQREYKRGKKQ